MTERHERFRVPEGEIATRIKLLQAALGSAGCAVGWIEHLTDRIYFAGTAQDGVLLVPVSGDPVFLFHMQTCRGLITTVSRSAPQGGITGFWFIDGQGGIAGFWHMADGQGGIARFWHMTEGRGRYSRVLAHGREKGEVEGFWFTAERKGRWQATQFWFTAGKQAGRQEGGRVGFRRCCHREGANC